MKLARVTGRVSADTFNCKPLGAVVKRYLRESKASVDPFARNKLWATYTNDLNPETLAEYHMDVLNFLRMLRIWGATADLGIFDPPYSPRQVKECYNGIGLKMKREDAWRTAGWTPEKDALNELMVVGGYVLCFGWNSSGMGRGRGYLLEEILLVHHGACHNDTICTVERKIGHQSQML